MIQETHIYHSQPKETLPSADGPLNIGFFTDTYAPHVNGIAISLELLTRGLRAAGHRVTVFAPRFPGCHDSDADVHRLPAVRYTELPPVYIAVAGTTRATLALHRTQFDILHVHSPLTVGLLAYLTARTKRVPLIYTNHTSITDYIHYLKVVGRTGPVRSAARWFSAMSANLSDRVVVPSAKFERLLHEQNVHRPLHIIPNGIDLSNFYKLNSSRSYRKKLGIAPDKHILVFVGRLDWEKRVDILIDTFTDVAARNPDAYFVIAGDGSFRPQLEAQAAASGWGERIRFLGMLSRAELPDLLHDSDLFLSASTSETQCLALVEAIAAGLPVVALHDDAFEGILMDGVNGRVVSRDVELFSQVVCELLADHATRQAFGRNSVELSRKFSVDIQIDSLVKLYREAIAARRPDSNRRIPASSW
jgi:1,2-diacylglycerol 3-alpha-glucosyltransferase